MNSPSHKHIYLVSDMHFGVPSPSKSLVREKHFVKWLDMIAPTASDIYLMGDLFDQWFEYKHVVPRGYIRFLGKLAELSDNGVGIHVFTGNHDLWYRDYFEHQLGATIYREPIQLSLLGKNFLLAHGDGLGPGDKGYKFLKAILTNRFCKWLFMRLHPNFAIGMADFFSGKSRDYNANHLPPYSLEKDSLLVYAKEMTKLHPEIQYFVFGHRHVPIQEEFQPGKEIVILGDWITHFTYLEVTQEAVKLKSYPMT